MSLLRALVTLKKPRSLRDTFTVLKIEPNGYNNIFLTKSQKEERVKKYLSEIGKEKFIDLIKKSKIDINEWKNRPFVIKEEKKEIKINEGPTIFSKEDGVVQVEIDKKGILSKSANIDDVNSKINLENVEIEHEKKVILKSIPKRGKINKKAKNENVTPKEPIIIDNSFILAVQNFLNSITDSYENSKNGLIDIIGKDIPKQEKYVDIIFDYALNNGQTIPLYAKVCRDIDRTLVPKKEKTKSAMRVKLIDKCKKYFRNEPKEEVITKLIYTHVINNVDFIAELISSQMISKKVGVQCINNLFEKYTATISNESKFTLCLLYIDSIVTLLDKFCTCVLYYQRSRIRKDDLEKFEKDINELVEHLTKIDSSKCTNEIKAKIQNIINKSQTGWAPSPSEAQQYEAINTLTSVSSVSQNGHSRVQTISSNSTEPISENKTINALYNDILKLKKHMTSNNKNTANNYSWKYIDKAIMKDKVAFSEILNSYIEAAILYRNNNNEKFYNEEYIRVIIEYYNHYFSQKECDRIVSTVINRVRNIYEESIDNFFIGEIMTCVIYNLMESQIFFMKDFDLLIDEKKETIRCVIGLMVDIAMYNKEKKDKLIKEVKYSKIAKMNRDIIISFQNNNTI